jgi:NAD-dependent deacetylase
MAFSERLLERLAAAERIVAFTGAGISAESGVPTFRGNDGIWAKFKPEELASIDAFMRNPELVWEWYSARKQIIASIEPNEGHRALVNMERVFSHLAVVTQNIDNLHKRAGSSMVYELHGNIERNYCMKCGQNYSNQLVLEMKGGHGCTKPKCDGLIRPDVVWFGELLPEDEWNHAVREMESADIVFSIGTSGVVYPAASLPLMAKQHGAFLVEVNPEPTSLTDHVDEFLMGRSGEILPALCEKAKSLRAEIRLSR